MKKQNGFTLIELMIVVAVIGVLSAIAIPQYQEYVKKSAVGTALASVSAYKTNIEDDIATTGYFPAVSAAFGIGTIKTANTASEAVSTTAGSPNKITAEILEGSGKGVKVQLQRANDEWVCAQNSGLDITGCPQDTIL
ncbi:pilin [Photobacterium leiognathi]|uniref:pilin n=1 Tax=Photobacterium leiognathi TaxID=553611 RepID=UPI0029829E44|nr:pilin [Photobacterium leiognathi]